jgi:hypothetical protein
LLPSVGSTLAHVIVEAENIGRPAPLVQHLTVVQRLANHDQATVSNIPSPRNA